ncbi:hypothetical protein PAMC26510_33775 [Caballeronia sordidicola]|uniref:Uncharacterized protein n=1 Tax=Caballeronia sordidicola TaxID=196367 RepID=A0A242M6I6_CABSO|nr:hypothetical protein PAMC26510_33775 [Caballeronia sordidicola]OTP79592.1 hypothetical protein PAMC26577_01595 [Caballeronia sordidicola]
MDEKPAGRTRSNGAQGHGKRSLTTDFRKRREARVATRR